MFVRLLSIGSLLREMARHLGASPLSRRLRLEALRGLGDHLLRDIDICRAAAMSERPADHQVDAQALYYSEGVALDG